MKPIIGIMSHSHVTQTGIQPGESSVGNSYVLSIEKTGGTPVVLPTIMDDVDMDTFIELCDGFLFSGGIDISPSCYNEEPHLKLGQTSMVLDNVQIPFMKKVLQTDKPVLGICRGHQVLNVATGGTLYQDLSEYDGISVKHFQDTEKGDTSHKVYLEPDSLLCEIFENTIFTNSYHHQAVKTVGPDVDIIAYSTDHVVEAIQVKNHSFALGIQWHPEAMFAYGDESMRPLFEAFIQASKKNKRK